MGGGGRLRVHGRWSSGLEPRITVLSHACYMYIVHCALKSPNKWKKYRPVSTCFPVISCGENYFYSRRRDS